MAGLTVCSGWHPAAWEHYARRFAETFAQHWPADVRLIVYTEEPVRLPRGECRSLWDIDGARAFVERNQSIPARAGRAPHPKWLGKDHRKWANGIPAWRWDALRFFKQCIIPTDAAHRVDDGDILVWLDADVVTFADVSADMVSGLLGNSDLCYLGRNKGAEIGFWAVRLNTLSRRFLGDLSGLYIDDRIFSLPQFHSAYAFDHARAVAERGGLKVRNLTPGGRDHVWMQCKPLMSVCDHLKGDRKNIGHSPEHPMRWWERVA